MYKRPPFKNDGWISVFDAAVAALDSDQVVAAATVSAHEQWRALNFASGPIDGIECGPTLDVAALAQRHNLEWAQVVAVIPIARGLAAVGAGVRVSTIHLAVLDRLGYFGGRAPRFVAMQAHARFAHEGPHARVALRWQLAANAHEMAKVEPVHLRPRLRATLQFRPVLFPVVGAQFAAADLVRAEVLFEHDAMLWRKGPQAARPLPHVAPVGVSKDASDLGMAPGKGNHLRVRLYLIHC